MSFRCPSECNLVELHMKLKQFVKELSNKCQIQATKMIPEPQNIHDPAHANNPPKVSTPHNVRGVSSFFLARIERNVLTPHMKLEELNKRDITSNSSQKSCA